MSERDEDREPPLEASDEQLRVLRDMGVAETELDGLTFGDAGEWIAELRAMREDERRVGRVGRE